MNYTSPISSELKNVATQTSNLINNHNPVTPAKRTSWDEFNTRFIMNINGYDLDYGKYKKRNNAPTFYGCVEDPRNLDHKEVRDLETNNLIVSFVVSGEYEWYDKNVPNVL